MESNNFCKITNLDDKMKRIETDIKETTWYKQAANVKVYYIINCCAGAVHCLGGKLGFWAFTNKRYMEAFLPHNRFTESAIKNLKLQKKDPEHINKIMKECEKRSKILTKFYEKLEQSNIQNINIKDVQKAMQKLDNLNYNYWCKAYFCDLYDPDGEEMLKKELEEENMKLSEKDINTLMKSNWRNYVQKERIALLNIAKQENKKEAIKEHAKKYFYINNSWESTTILDEKYFYKKINEIEDIDEELKTLSINLDDEQKKLQKKHSISKELMNTFYYYRQLCILRDKRKKHTLLSNHYYDMLFKRLSELLDIPFDDMRIIAVEEVVKDVDPIHIKKLISQRQNLLLDVYTDKKKTLLSGGKGAGLFNLLQKSYGHTGTLRGKSACKGKVKGIARIIIGETHFSKFNEGEILVAPMTRPEFVPLMKKASAIITDEGGLTCHAAIISRELGIPCIVGTKTATTKLKDSMFVEVDATTGIIKILRHLKIITVQNLVNKELEKNPYLIKVLNEGLLNITAAAEKFHPKICQQMGRDIKIHAISMSIRRYAEKKLKN